MIEFVSTSTDRVLGTAELVGDSLRTTGVASSMRRTKHGRSLTPQEFMDEHASPWSNGYLMSRES